MNDWNALRKHYRALTKAIEATPKNEWATDAYAFEGLVRMTPIEQWLWHDIRAVDAVLYPQFPILGFFVDFANPRAKVAIECDGAAYHDESKDAARDAKLTNAGWVVYRISGSDCRDGVGLDSGENSKARNFIKQIAMNHKLLRA